VAGLCGKHSAGSSFNVLAVFATRTLTARPLQVGLLLSLQGAKYMGSLTDRLLEECGFWSGGAATRAVVVPFIRQGLLDSPAGLHLQNPGVPNEFASGDGGRVLFHAVPRR
jgi:hypothetical protein